MCWARGLQSHMITLVHHYGKGWMCYGNATFTWNFKIKHKIAKKCMLLLGHNWPHSQILSPNRSSPVESLKNSAFSKYKKVTPSLAFYVLIFLTSSLIGKSNIIYHHRHWENIQYLNRYMSNNPKYVKKIPLSLSFTLNTCKTTIANKKWQLSPLIGSDLTRDVVPGNKVGFVEAYRVAQCWRDKKGLYAKASRDFPRRQLTFVTSCPLVLNLNKQTNKKSTGLYVNYLPRCLGHSFLGPPRTQVWSPALYGVPPRLPRAPRLSGSFYNTHTLNQQPYLSVCVCAGGLLPPRSHWRSHSVGQLTFLALHCFFLKW